VDGHTKKNRRDLLSQKICCDVLRIDCVSQCGWGTEILLQNWWRLKISQVSGNHMHQLLYAEKWSTSIALLTGLSDLVKRSVFRR
jgi:nitrogen fixation protein